VNKWLPLIDVVIGGILGAVLSYLPARRLAKLTRRSEMQFQGYVAIQRFLATTHDSALYDARGYETSPAASRPDMDHIGPEAEAIANLVASHEVLVSLSHYIASLRAFRDFQERLNSLRPHSEDGLDISNLLESRAKIFGERREALDRLTSAFTATNRAMRKDLDIPEVDWDYLDDLSRA
jgi:hypothetical protein